MKKRPLNSITLFAATHSKLRKVADGTGTQVATCMINKWTAKINEKEIYNGRCPSRVGGRKKERKKKEDGCSSYHPWKLSLLSIKEPRRRRISLRAKLEDKLLPFPHALDHSISIWSCPAVEALTKTQFLNPFSLPNLLYRARWVWAYSSKSKKPPKVDPTIYIKAETSCESAWGPATWHSNIAFNFFYLFPLSFFTVTQ